MSVAILRLNSLYFDSLYSRLGEEGVRNRPTVLRTAVKKAHDEFDNILPIVPRTSFDSLNSFYSNYTGHGGWIDVGDLPASKTSELRELGKGIMGGRNYTCGHPKIIDNATQTTIPDKNASLEYCFWEADLVSEGALNNFKFERTQWEFVAKSFLNLQASHPHALAASNDGCDRLGFIDIGVNVGDWLSPIRLMAPDTVPIYGVEGSPGTAAIATANLLTSSLYAASRSGRKSYSKMLPFTLAAKSQISTIDEQGGVCFAQAYYNRKNKLHNIGGRSVETNKKMNRCKNSADVAGATTLEHALGSLCPSSNAIPKAYILKIDIEGYEYRAISSVISNWLAKAPPCYFVMEVWKKNSYKALIETLTTVVGYDAIWRPRENEYPTNKPPWMTLTGTDEEVNKIFGSFELYSELVFGFNDVDKCVNNLMGKVEVLSA